MALSAPAPLFLSLVAGTPGGAPETSFSISGRLTGPDGRSVRGARVMAYPQIGSLRDSVVGRLIGMPEGPSQPCPHAGRSPRDPDQLCLQLQELSLDLELVLFEVWIALLQEVEDGARVSHVVTLSGLE